MDISTGAVGENLHLPSDRYSVHLLSNLTA